MPIVQDGPCSALFTPVSLKGNTPLAKLADLGVSDEMAAASEHAPSGDCVAWGIPFEIGDVVAISDQVVPVELDPTVTRWPSPDRRQADGHDGATGSRISIITACRTRSTVLETPNLRRMWAR